MERKIESFTSLRKSLAMSGIILQRSTQRFNSKNWTIIILTGLGAITIEHPTNDDKLFQQYTDIIYRVLYLIVLIVIYTIIVWKTKELAGFVNHLERRINKRIVLHPELQSLYLETSQRIEKWIKALHYILVVISPPIFSVPSFIISFYAYYTTDLGGDAFQFLYPLWLPFDTKAPIGYSVAIVLQYFIVFSVMNILKCIFTIGVATLPLLFPLIDDMKHDLKAIQQSLKDKTKRKRASKSLSHFVRFHSDTRQLTHAFSNFWQIILMMYCSNSVIGICCILLLMEMEILHQSISNIDPVELINLIGQINKSLMEIFAICELGERVSIAFEKIHFEINMLRWYLLPTTARRVLPTILIATQEPMAFDIFGSTACNRITFKGICHKVYSSFMVFRKFDY